MFLSSIRSVNSNFLGTFCSIFLWGVESWKWPIYPARLLLEDEDTWVVETLAWWNWYISSLPFNLHDNILHRQIFPDKPGTKNQMNKEQWCWARPWQYSIKGQTCMVTEGQEIMTTCCWRIRMSQHHTFINASFCFIQVSMTTSTQVVSCLSYPVLIFTQFSFSHHHAVCPAFVYCSYCSFSSSLNFLVLCLSDFCSPPLMYLMPIHVFLPINSYCLLWSFGCVIVSEIWALLYIIRNVWLEQESNA